MDKAQAIDQELRKLASAAYMAHYYGASREEILAALEDGMAEAQQLLDQRQRTTAQIASLRAA